MSVMAGGGKTITASSFIHKYQTYFKFVVIVRKRDLVEQFAKSGLDLFGINYAIFMSGHKADLTKRVQVCSKDTIDARNILPFEGEQNVIVMVDECDEYKEWQKELIKRYEYPRSFDVETVGVKNTRFFYFGMTATPYNGLDQFDVAIEPIKPRQLRDRGILVDFKYYIPKVQDFRDVEIKNGAWNAGKIQEKMNSPKMIQEAFKKWLMYGEDRQTMIFCSNKEHSKRMVKFINEQYDRKIAVHCDADTPEQNRIESIKAFREGRIRFICVVRLFIRGTDIPEIGCLLDLAPTLSENNHIQKLGRGSRKNDFYRDCICIDLSNNLINNGHFYQDREIDLASDGKKTKSDLEVVGMYQCGKCFRACEPEDIRKLKACPYCGHGIEFKTVKKKPLSDYMKNKIFMESASEEAIEQRKIINEFKKLLWQKENLGNKYSSNIAREKAQIDILKKYGIDKINGIRGALGLTDEVIEKFNRRYNYKPLDRT